MARTGISDELTADEELIIAAIEDDSYFVDNIVPSGTINGSNTAFTLPSTPNPADSLKLQYNGQLMKAGGEDYTLSGATVTLNVAPISGDILLASYRLDPT